MKNPSSRFGVLLVLLLFLSVNLASQTYDANFQDGKIYFKFKDNVNVNIPVNPDRTVNLEDAPLLSGLMEEFSLSALSRPYDLNNDPKLLRTFMLEFSQYEEIEEIISTLSLNEQLEYVEKVPLAYLDVVIPNDELYNLSFGSSNWNWHLDVVNAEMAWEITLGSPDINIAIVDNAVWMDHEDLAEKLVLTNDVTSAGTSSNPPATGDPGAWSHGTHCAGLAAGHTDNTVGIASLGWDVSLIGVKASHNSSPSSITHGYAGIQWAAANGAHVISCSWGNSFFSQTEQNVINSIYDMGVVVLASAGNSNTSGAHYPSGYNHVISVASTDEDDLKSDFSSYGTTVDISAPGGYGISGPQGLMSTVYDLTSFGHYDTYFGTSMSTPFAAGLAGLIFSLNPDLSPDEVEDIMESTAYNIDTIPGNASWAGMLGAGRIDAYNAVLNTPFEPVAEFMTPVPYITPGTTIDFFDLSQGVPDSWSWEFEGGDPGLSGDENPSVTYNTEGIYNVSLAVSNDFGLNVLTVEDYIEVTSTPVPWVLFSPDTGYTCKGDPVVFTDESLYDPTEWLWEFDPATVTFVNGTSAGSQNPEVTFDEPGMYAVTLNATNQNGTGSHTVVDLIEVEGIQMNYEENFESGAANDLILTNNLRSKIRVDERASTPESTYGLHFEGGGVTSGWTGGPFDTTPEEAWEINTDFHASAANCNVDATGIEGITLKLDLRQTFSIGQTYSWFRVLINGEQAADVYGVENFNPETNEDPFETITFDLSAYGDSEFDIVFQSSCYLGDGFGGLEGDNVFVDNVMITNTTSLVDNTSAKAGVLVYPNPAKDILNLSVNGLGKEFTLTLTDVQGKQVYRTIMKNYTDGAAESIDLRGLTKGIYLLKLTDGRELVSKKIIIE